MFATVVLVQVFALGVVTAQSTDKAWELIDEERLLNPEDGDWTNYRRT